MSRRGSFMVNTDGRDDEPSVNPNDHPAVQDDLVDARQIPEADMISYIEEIHPDVFIGEEIVTTDNHNHGLNTTLAGLMDKEANDFVKEPEMDMVEKPEDIARISRIMKNLLKTSNDNVQISNEKYVEITFFQARAQNQLTEFQDKLELATEEIALLKHTVSRVDGSLTKVSNGMDTMTQK